MDRRGLALFASLLAHGILGLVAASREPRPPTGGERVALRITHPTPEVLSPRPDPQVVTPPPAPPPPTKAPRTQQRSAPPSAAPPQSAGSAATRTTAETPPEPTDGLGSSAVEGGGSVELGRNSGSGWRGQGELRPGPNLDVPLAPPGPSLVPAPPASSPEIALSPRAGGGYVYRDRGFQAEIAHDGTVEFDDHLPVQLGGESTGGIPVATFDLTEAVMMIAGDDPYRADKERFLAATATLRAGLCEAAHQERLRTALYELDRHLDAIWQDQHQAATARRELLFQLWDECLEPAPDTTDLTERTALQARATILGYIQKNLPAGSPSAYPAQELLALNQRRRSKAPFDPYRSDRDAGADCE